MKFGSCHRLRFLQFLCGGWDLYRARAFKSTSAPPAVLRFPGSPWWL